MILVDGYEIGPVSTGVGRVIHNLIMELSSVTPYEFMVVSRREISEYRSKANIHSRVIPYAGGYFWWQNRIMMREIKKGGWSLFIGPNYTLPLWFRGRAVLLEHDISFVAHPGWFSRKEAIKRKFLVGRSLKKSTLVMTVSHFSRREILRYFPVDPGKVHVVYHGVDCQFHPAENSEVKKWKDSKGFRDEKVIGFLGSIFNRRHIPLLVRAVAKLRDRIPASLYIVGKDLTCPAQNVEGLLDRPWIRWEQSLPDEQLPVFYSALDAFAYLSEYEGFGLPPLEALACGTLPVLLNRTALAEIYPDIAVMVDDVNAEEVKGALWSALTDAGLRKNKMDSFQKQRQMFTWKRAAGEWAAHMEALLRS
jgi:glycosyltransferase involved in cell wall biosynthesis